MTARICPYLQMNGTAAEAVRFYEKALGAEVVGVVNFGEMPADHTQTLTDEQKNRIAHAHLKIGGTDLMLADTFPGQPHSSGNQVTVMFLADNPDTARRVFDALADGANVIMPLEKTFWSPAYGMLVDKFGVTFQISTDQ